MNRWTIIFMVILMAGSFYIGYTISEPEIVEKTDTLTTTDTVFTPAKIDTQIRYVTRFKEKTDTIVHYDTDTLYKVKSDTLYQKDTVYIAHADTCFKQGCLEAYYYFPPRNEFQFNWQGKSITKTKVVQEHWLLDEKLWGAIGLGLGVLIAK